MEKNFVSDNLGTCFYVDIVNKTYGVCINVKDIDKADNIINDFREKRKIQIEAWQREWGVNKNAIN